LEASAKMTRNSVNDYLRAYRLCSRAEFTAANLLIMGYVDLGKQDSACYFYSIYKNVPLSFYGNYTKVREICK
jgi:hypothetical protein